MKCDADVRKDMLGYVVLSGGTTMFQVRARARVRAYVVYAHCCRMLYSTLCTHRASPSASRVTSSQ
jgi:hypothetical protein